MRSRSAHSEMVTLGGGRSTAAASWKQARTGEDSPATMGAAVTPTEIISSITIATKNATTASAAGTNYAQDKVGFSSGGVNTGTSEHWITNTIGTPAATFTNATDGSSATYATGCGSAVSRGST